MSDDVRSIFKTLIKVPCIIFVSYLVFNIFAFTFTFYKVLGASYIVMQTVVENNYIPPNDYDSITDYLSTVTNSASLIGDCYITAGWDGSTTKPPQMSRSGGNNRRTQYGSVKKEVGVYCEFIMQWPLMPTEQTTDYDESKGFGMAGQGDAVTGFSGQTITAASGSDLEARRNDKSHRLAIPITITYTVPGLQYYADLA